MVQDTAVGERSPCMAINNIQSCPPFTTFWMFQHRLIARISEGSVRVFDVAGLFLSTEDLVAKACSDEWLLHKDDQEEAFGFDRLRFSDEEVANDPLIREVWDPRASVCD